MEERLEEGVFLRIKPEETPQVLVPREGYYELHLGKLAEKVAKLGVEGIKRLIHEIKKRDKERFKKALEEVGVEVIRLD